MTSEYRIIEKKNHWSKKHCKNQFYKKGNYTKKGLIYREQMNQDIDYNKSLFQVETFQVKL